MGDVRQMSELWKTRLTYLGIALTTLATFLLSAEFDALEWFYEYSRAHEDWNLDEILVLVLNLVLGLLVALLVRSRQLRRAMRARRIAEKQANRMARHDVLTGLANRRALQDRLNKIDAAPEAGQHATVLMILDLDRFKPVNDLHGHIFGDAILYQVAQHLRKAIEKDDFVARLGGDEFALILAPDRTPEDAERLARRLVGSLSRPFHHEGISVSIGASIGLSVVAPGAAAETALKRSDQALYAAKRDGRGQVAWYDADLDAKAHERAQLEGDLREALRGDQIIPFFQPIVDIRSGRLRGFEVLARWQHPDHGLLGPDLFIGIAEDIGAISRLGIGILRQACAIAADWDPSLKLSVNISPQQFKDLNLVPDIKTVLQETGFPPHRLELEITESAIIDDLDMARRSIDGLRDFGISIALDDFGTGFSSLAYLRQLPFDRIKIDRSFVTGMEESPSNQKIVSGILALARGLELSVTAEGIETQSELSYLLSLDCPLGQGYLFDKPMPGEGLPPDAALSSKEVSYRQPVSVS